MCVCVYSQKQTSPLSPSLPRYMKLAYHFCTPGPLDLFSQLLLASLEAGELG